MTLHSRAAAALASAAALLLGACATAGGAPVPAAPTPGAEARFDWFSYQGDDSIYHRVQAGPGQYSNPILAGFYPDPSMVAVGGDYYLVNSSFSYFPGVPIFHSTDLVHWTQLGSVLDRPSQLDLDSLGVSRGIFAPAIRYHDGTFYMITTCADCGGNFFVTATNPAGPWSDPVWLREVDGIDPSFFFDDDGRAYVLNNGPPVGQPLYQGHRAIWIQEFDAKAQKMVGPRRVIVNGGTDLSKKPIWIEGPHLFHVNGAYYLMCAEGGTGEQHSEVVFRSDSVWGPYVPYAGNPILTQRQLDPARPAPITTTGHADFVRTPKGEWWAVFLGARPYQDDMYNTGRETFLMPVRWENGWPVITADDEQVPYVHAAPDLPRSPSDFPRSGNFTVRDDFTAATLAPYWEMLRTPRERWYDLTSAPGWLTLRARPVALGSLGQPSFLARRQQNQRASVSTAMVYSPARPGDRAGITAFQNEEHYYLLSETLDGDTPVVQLQKRAGGAPEVIASAPLHLAPGRPLYLRIDADGPRYDFYYATRPGEWTLLKGGADGTILSTRVAGGFVGAMFGMYAYDGR
ncbi:MAG TPA: glycoside hydrolase family 43 protein [Longimicrobiaceae bacterium]|nr:glycoside hydrolase family 43 protein [Longimicrobiaceae bacterium]